MDTFVTLQHKLETLSPNIRINFQKCKDFFAFCNPIELFTFTG